jgi:diadenosine tetraphosphate (Ap4A) HIT family hydrolase
MPAQALLNHNSVYENQDIILFKPNEKTMIKNQKKKRLPSDFQLDPILERDSVFITNMKFSQLRLINNSDFPWLIIIPMKENLVEITDLTDDEYHQMNSEIRNIAKTLLIETSADKLNIATIGNVVSQLHIHIIARYQNDKLFPNPVWGCKFTPYTKDKSDAFIKKILLRI